MTRRTALQLGAAAAYAQGSSAAGSRLLLDTRLVTKTTNLNLSIAPSEKVAAPLTIDGKTIWCPNNLYASIWREPNGEFRGVWGEHMIEQIGNLGAAHLMRSSDGLTWQTYGDWVMWPGAMMRDERERDRYRRYKSVFRAQAFTGLTRGPGPTGQTLAPVGMFAATSEDGQLWLEFSPILMLRMQPGVRFWKVGAPGWVGGDNNPGVLWAPSLNRYVALFRTSIKNGPGKRRERAVGISVSEDFIHWGPHELVFRADPYGARAHGLPLHDIHGMQAWYCGGVYLGVLEPYYWEEDRMHLELAWSPDMRDWRRIAPGTDFVPHPPLGQPDGGCRFAACGTLRVGEEVWIYWGADSEKFQSRKATGKERMSSLFVAKFKRDRFAGWRTNGSGPAELETVALPLKTGALRLNVDASQGEVLPEFCDEAGKPLAGFSRADAEPIRGDHSDATLRWKGSPSLSPSRPVRLRLIASGNVTLYSLS